MRYVHFRKIIHRDLKPSNIFITEDKTVKIGDFGISKLMTTEQQTLMTGCQGTLFFMAPEVADSKNYNEKADVYSFGVLIYFILSNGEMPKLTLSQYTQGKKAPIPSNFSAFAKNLINDCWNFDPKRRPSFESICENMEKNSFNLIELTNPEIENIQQRITQYKKTIPHY